MQQKRFESYKKVCESKEFYNVIMPSEDTKILEFNQYQKSDKASFIIYADFEYLMQKKYLRQEQANIFHQVFQCL